MQTALISSRTLVQGRRATALGSGVLLGLLILIVVLAVWPDPAQAERIKDLAAVQGVRTNKLTGVGLVVGLDGTGDQTTQVPQTTQGLMSMLQQFGIVVPPGTTVQTRNIAIVAITAELPPFAKPGQEIDVTVLSQGNSKSLRGGTLLSSPLKGLDGQVYAIAQGNLIVGGAGASAGGSKVQINSLNAGRIPGGATVERSVPTPLLLGDSIQLALNADDYSTARLVARAINDFKGSGTAQALDGRTVRVAAPTNPDDRINLLAELENLKLDLMTPFGQGRDQRPHRLHRDEPGRHAQCLCHRARQPGRDNHLHATGQPARTAFQRPDHRHHQDRYFHQAGTWGPHSTARQRQARRRGQGIEFAGRHAW